MIPSIENMSPETLRCLARARQEAKRTGKHLIGTEHILVGIVVEAKGKLKRALKNAGLDKTLVCETANRIAGMHTPHDDENLSLTPRTERILREAALRAHSTNSQTVLPEHILLAMVDTDAGIATRIMETLGTDRSLLTEALCVQ